MKKSSKLLLAFLPALIICCEKASTSTPTKEVTPTEQEAQLISLISPDEGASIAISGSESYEFKWQSIDGVTMYKLNFSLKSDMSDPKSVAALRNPLSITGSSLDSYIADLGVESQGTATIYWSVSPWSSEVKYENEVRSFTVTRMEDAPETLENADPITVKVAIIYEDPVYYNKQDASDSRNGKRIHEIRGWHDPHEQSEQYAKSFEKISHGVIDIDVVMEIESEQMFCYHTNSSTSKQKNYVTVDTLINYYFDEDMNGSYIDYDYVGMMQYYKLDSLVDAGAITEIWVYNHPTCHMNESRLIGPGAFYCNSGGIQPPTATNTKNMVCVMFCNYERTVDLALHSFGHRFESMMRPIYGEEDAFNNYDDKPHLSDLTMFELFCGRLSNFGEKYDKGRGHLGICHFPFNGESDYDYENKTYGESYCDEWDNYPNIPMKNARRMNCEEWADREGYQMGYMKWWLGHMPHFKGLNPDPADMHLNNWWHYLFAYQEALIYEQELRQFYSY